MNVGAEPSLGVTHLALGEVTIGISEVTLETVIVFRVLGGEKTTTSKNRNFGGYGIQLDENLANVLGGREGQRISPAEMTKKLWQYIKTHHLGGKAN